MASLARGLRPARSAVLALSSRSAARSPMAPLPANLRLRGFSATAIKPIRKYTKDHEWIDLNADQTQGVIGISEYAAEALGDVVYVELPEEGKEVQAGDAIGAVESVKSAADINAPIACKITHVNTTLEEKPATINQVPEDDSHGGGWIAKVSVGQDGVKDLDGLMDAEAYKAFTAEKGEEAS